MSNSFCDWITQLITRSQDNLKTLDEKGKKETALEIQKKPDNRVCEVHHRHTESFKSLPSEEEGPIWF